ncbi:hypothetical protein H0H92_009488 [Tricholoma furcatifolium]|nr:hypothetical protein H0H92_009488 [Tricholoma furcatifolium]
MNFKLTLSVLLAAVTLAVNGEQHTVHFDNRCGYGTKLKPYSANLGASRKDPFYWSRLRFKRASHFSNCPYVLSPNWIWVRKPSDTKKKLTNVLVNCQADNVSAFNFPPD